MQRQRRIDIQPYKEVAVEKRRWREGLLFTQKLENWWNCVNTFVQGCSLPDMLAGGFAILYHQDIEREN